MDNRCTAPCASVRRERRWALRRRRRGSLNRARTNAVLTGQSGKLLFCQFGFPRSVCDALCDGMMGDRSEVPEPAVVYVQRVVCVPFGGTDAPQPDLSKKASLRAGPRKLCAAS